MGRISRVVFLFVLAIGIGAAPRQQSVRIIVQGGSLEAASAAVTARGGVVLGSFASISALVAEVPAGSVAGLEAAGLRVTPDRMVETSGERERIDAELEVISGETYPADTTGAAALHAQGLTGKGVTVAVIDSGMPALNANWQRVDATTLRFQKIIDGRPWFIVYKDFVSQLRITQSSDPYGHGTHVLATIADGRAAPSGSAIGIAPDANLLMVRALDETGQAPYSRIIQAIDWVIANKQLYNIKVLNLSLQAPIHGPYWHDPLAQAVMAAWAEGITVVAAAGNAGPAPATITVPGNVPYVITVGAVKPGVYTGSGVDELAYYSSAGPTESKFVKPDVVIAGSRVVAPMPIASALEPQAGKLTDKAKVDMSGLKSRDELGYYLLSGTSMAAAEVSGMVALLLQDEPALSNNQIKYRLINTAEIATDGAGQAAYSIWQQGGGRVNPQAMIAAATTQSANAGMDIALDRDHESGTHYMGNTAYDEATYGFYFAGQPVNIGSYQSWAGSYQSWAGSYQSWAGSYQSWAGSYQSWAGSYQSWAGSTSVWSTSYQSWAGNLVADE
ncbi:MAG TPA: S8 family peptidase [Herpetosiphonaceae bacterium]